MMLQTGYDSFELLHYPGLDKPLYEPLETVKPPP